MYHFADGRGIKGGGYHYELDNFTVIWDTNRGLGGGCGQDPGSSTIKSSLDKTMPNTNKTDWNGGICHRKDIRIDDIGYLLPDVGIYTKYLIFPS